LIRVLSRSRPAAAVYVSEKLPMIYVVFITWVVKLTLFSYALRASFDLAIARLLEDWAQFALTTVLVLLISVVFQGCLTLHTVLSNPFGEDTADFPQSKLFRGMAASCYAQLEGPTVYTDMSKAFVTSGRSGPATALEAELAMMTVDQSALKAARARARTIGLPNLNENQIFNMLVGKQRDLLFGKHHSRSKPPKDDTLRA
jgi:hypothetical protein